jgi:hypothetical protein
MVEPKSGSDADMAQISEAVARRIENELQQGPGGSTSRGDAGAGGGPSGDR